MFATDAQKKLIKKLLKEKFNVDGKLEEKYKYLRLVNNSLSDPVDRKIRINSKGFLDGNQIDKLKASGIISTLMSRTHSLKNGKWCDEGCENICFMELI